MCRCRSINASRAFDVLAIAYVLAAAGVLIRRVVGGRAASGCRRSMLIFSTGRPDAGLTSSPARSKSVAFVEADGADIVLLTSSVTPPGDTAFRFIDQRCRKRRAPMVRADHELVEIAFASMVTNPISASACSATTIAAFGTSSLRQRSRHQSTRAAKSIEG